MYPYSGIFRCYKKLFFSHLHASGWNLQSHFDWIHFDWMEVCKSSKTKVSQSRKSSNRNMEAGAELEECFTVALTTPGIWLDTIRAAHKTQLVLSGSLMWDHPAVPQSTVHTFSCCCHLVSKMMNIKSKQRKPTKCSHDKNTASMVPL